MASRYSNFPVSLYQYRSWDKCFSVWMWTVIQRFDKSTVSGSVHVCVWGQAESESAELSSCSPQTATDPLSYPPIIVLCYLACLSGKHCENQSRLRWDGAWLNVLGIAMNAFWRLGTITHLLPFSSPLSSSTCTCLYYVTMWALQTEGLAGGW